MQTEFLIIGQGICGTFLSWELQKANRSFIIIDEANPTAASKVASGIINPITGRRMVKTWMIEELLPFAFNAYQEIGKELGIDCIAQKNIIDCFPTAQMRLAFLERMQEDAQYLSLPTNESDYSSYLNYELGYGIIDPCYLIDLQALLSTFRKKITSDYLIEDHFDIDKLKVENDKIYYKDIIAEKIIFCDGRNAIGNPYFSKLPFALSKGEALIVDIPELPANHIFKKGVSIVPWKGDLFWIGSSYEWDFEDDQPTTVFRERMINQLNNFVKLPFTVVDHLASLRPGTLERRPFVGWHPNHANIGIFNGMGTKGCSLAPYFAREFVKNIVSGQPILPTADVERFTKVLRR